VLVHSLLLDTKRALHLRACKQEARGAERAKARADQTMLAREVKRLRESWQQQRCDTKCLSQEQAVHEMSCILQCETLCEHEC